MEIIPAIDLIDGACVRLTQGDYTRKTSYYKDPVDTAKRYEDIGLRRLHLIDLDGAKAAFPQNLAALEHITSQTRLDVQFGGGIKSIKALQTVFACGASRAICGSIAVTEPELFEKWLDDFGPARMILGADIKNGFVATHGWLKKSELSVETVTARFAKAGLVQLIVTDISKDGMLQGPSFDLYEKLQNRFPKIDISVSGGIRSIDDITKLNRMGLRSVVVGKAIYENLITLKELKLWVQNASFPA